jgi:hypothetical protein
MARTDIDRAAIDGTDMGGANIGSAGAPPCRTAVMSRDAHRMKQRADLAPR